MIGGSGCLGGSDGAIYNSPSEAKLCLSHLVLLWFIRIVACLHARGGGVDYSTQGLAGFYAESCATEQVYL